MSHPNKNTLPQYNSVARCKIFAIQNCTILTYVAPFCTIPWQKLLWFSPIVLLFQKLSADYYSEHADAIFLFLVPLILAKMTKSRFLEHKKHPTANKCNGAFYLELIPGFEPGTSSLPRMCSADWAILANSWRLLIISYHIDFVKENFRIFNFDIP